MAKAKIKGKKELLKIINLKIEPGKATPAPPVGPALGQNGLNIKEFCDQFNKMTGQMKPLVQGAKLAVKIHAFNDKTFEIKIGGFPTTDYIKLKAGVKAGSKTTGTEFVGSITKSQLREVAQEKIKDMNTNNIESALSMVYGTAVSMGIEVKED